MAILSTPDVVAPNANGAMATEVFVANKPVPKGRVLMVLHVSEEATRMVLADKEEMVAVL